MIILKNNDIDVDSVVFLAECCPMSQSLDENEFPTSYDYIMLSKEESNIGINLFVMNGYYVSYVHSAYFIETKKCIQVTFEEINELLTPKNFICKVEGVYDDSVDITYKPKYLTPIKVECINRQLYTYIKYIIKPIEFTYAGLKVLYIGFANTNSDDDSITKEVIPYHKIYTDINVSGCKEMSQNDNKLIRTRIQDITEHIC